MGKTISQSISFDPEVLAAVKAAAAAQERSVSYIVNKALGNLLLGKQPAPAPQSTDPVHTDKRPAVKRKRSG